MDPGHDDTCDSHSATSLESWSVPVECLDGRRSLRIPTRSQTRLGSPFRD